MPGEKSVGGIGEPCVAATSKPFTIYPFLGTRLDHIPQPSLQLDVAM